jgi:hypothetical protein
LPNEKKDWRRRRRRKKNRIAEHETMCGITICLGRSRELIEMIRFDAYRRGTWVTFLLASDVTPNNVRLNELASIYDGPMTRQLFGLRLISNDRKPRYRGTTKRSCCRAGIHR